MNNIVNEYGSQLDLVFSSDNLITVLPSVDNIVPVDRYHPPFIIRNNNKHSMIRDCSKLWFYNFKNINFQLMNNMLASINWTDLYSTNDVNVAVDIFYKELLTIVNCLVKKVYINQLKFPAWYSSDLRLLIIDKKKAHKAFKITGDNKFYIEFSSLRSQCKELSKLCYSNF